MPPDDLHPVDPGRLTATRRRFLTLGGAAAALALTTRLPGVGSATAQGRPPSAYPFTLGVASGDPLPDGVVLWTRLAPRPLERFGGMDYRDVVVRWEVATDERFARVVRAGAATARPEYGHAVHVDVRGLRPGREYHYRFRTGLHESSPGRTRTAPAAGSSASSLAFAFVSCQRWEDGFYTAYRHLAEEELDLVVHLGDTIYEYPIGPGSGVRGVELPADFARETDTLDRYRQQHALYRTDPDLQAVHARFPFAVTWDDHEVDNNYADDRPEDGAAPVDFLVRRANAYRAYWEHMPLRPLQEPTGPDMPLYRRLRFGDLAEFNVLDTRQYRSDQACGGGGHDDCDERDDPARTMLGDAQERWLLDGLSGSRARWNVLAQQVLMSQLDTDTGPGTSLGTDAWDGYRAGRQRLFDGMVQRGVRNPVVLVGDVHRNYAAELKTDFDDPASATVAPEFTCTSITSAGDGADGTSYGDRLLRANPHLAFTNAQRGYVRCTLTDQLWRTDYRVVPYVSTPGAPISTRASFVVADGDPSLQPA